MIIDTHAHLYWDSFQKDLGEVIKRALDAEVTHLINIGVDVDTSQMAAELPSDKIKFYSTVGIHPHEAIRYTNNPTISINQDIERLEMIYRQNPKKVVAVGECGLDYVEVDDQIKNFQKKLFQTQIDLAKKLNLPLIVHCRDDRSQNPQNSEAWNEVVEMTKNHFGIYHCYSGLPPTTNYILQTTRSARGAGRANFLVSFAGNITYPKNEYLREAIQKVPLDRIAIETDCPFLPPQSKRGMRNEPANITEVVKIIAQIKKRSVKYIEKALYQNTIHAVNAL